MEWTGTKSESGPIRPKETKNKKKFLLNISSETRYDNNQ